jgi:iron complex outermembrane receptor protein
MKKQFILLFFLIGFFSLSAQESARESIMLDETIIQAYKADASMPVSYKNMDEAAINVQNTGQEPAQILSNMPSINAYSDAGNFQGYSYFRLRGMDQTRINMTLDGIPLNEPEDQGAYFSNYPDFFNSLQTIQVQRGVGTTSNGVASYAGSINFESVNTQGERSGELGMNYGSYNTYRAYGEFLSGVKKGKSLYIRASALGSDGYKYHSGNKSYSTFLSSELQKRNHHLKFVGFIGNQQNEMAWIGVSKAQINEDARTNGNASEEDDCFTQALVSLQDRWTLSDSWVLNSTVYYNVLDGNYDFDYNNYLGLTSTDEMYNYDFLHHFAGFISNINWYHKNLKFNAGIHANTYNRRHIGSELTYGKLYENTGYKKEFSSFAKLRYALGNFTLYGDVQYRYTNFDYEGSVDMEKLDWNFLNPKVGLVYQLNENCNLYYSFGRSGREPTRNDLFSGSDDLYADASGEADINEMDAEYVNDHELGVRLNTSKLALSANFYYMAFENEIVLNGSYGPNGLALHGNVANSYRSGFELDLTLSLTDRFYCANNSSFAHNRISEEGVEFQPVLSPPVIVNQLIGFKTKKLNTSISGKYQSDSYVDFANAYKVPSFYTFNWRATYAFKKVDFQVEINNLTDRRVIASGYLGDDGTPLYFAQAPLNFNLALVWNL